MLSLDLIYVMAVYFLLILLFGGAENRVHSAIILLSSALNVTFQLPEPTDLTSYIFNRNVFVLWDGITAFMLTMFLIFDRVAWKQALILCFATLCHLMIIYDLTIASSWFSQFFYNYYDELIITVGLTQMAISYNGIYTALRTIRKFVRGFDVNNWRSSAGNASLKSGEIEG